ncbi:hypothetical protein C9374_012160 [Naegleria lovaniensis]|uniref:PNPLA domain-containing protein n=1 Tax=Naegleria lovaniensis TaxID=51637 RepID=A0AA88GBI4_NAELO|nr:uncharacterized protein C9374_012160 [Naegleria lovaniensis]KAG2373421.1 hypothetical protein C9374_012160 [Naegleria lovaniensis]
MDYYILKTLDRWFWAEKYAQENYDPLKQKSKFFHKEGTKIHFSEPTFLKEIVLDKKNRRRRIFNVKLEDPALDIDFNDPSAVLWKNVDGHLVTNFDHLRQEKKGKTVKVLTMDGGGMKGLILIEILTVIEERVGKKICDIFDIVAGTSTGGICALLINRGIPMKIAKEFYIEIGRTVFDLKTTRNKSFVKTMKVLRGRSWYDGYPLELSSLKLSQDVELNHMHAKKPLTFIVTTMNKSTNPKMNLDEPTACVLRTYSDPYEYGSKNGDSSSKKQPTFYRGTLSGVGITCTDALRATSAAPMYFKARRIGDTECIDGAVVANNPTSIALYETKQIFPNHDKFVFISLGTGALSGKSSQSDTNDGDEEVNLNISPTTKTKKKGISKVFKGISQTINTLLSVVNLQLSSERIHKMASAQLEFFKEGKTLCEYFRLNVPKLGDYGLDEVSDELVSIFEKETKAYIENHPDLDRICELLKQE